MHDVVEGRRVQDRAVDAQPHVAVRWSGRRSRSRRRSRTPCRTRARAGRGSRARRRSRARPRASRADRRHRPRRAGRPPEFREQQVGDRTLVAHAAVVGGDARAVEQRRARRRARHRGSRAAPRRRCASCQIASGAVPTPPPTSSGRRPSRGGAKPIPNGPAIHRPSPARSSPSRVVPGPTASSMNSRRAVDAAHDAERARQERALVGAPAPALGRGQHVELAGVGRGPVRVVADEDVVGADAAVLEDLRQAAPERRERPRHSTRVRTELRFARAAPAARPPAGSPTRAAAIARAAAIPPAIVVMHGHAAGDRRAADLVAVRARGGAGRRVDHEVDVAAVDPVDDVVARRPGSC